MIIFHLDSLHASTFCKNIHTFAQIFTIYLFHPTSVKICACVDLIFYKDFFSIFFPSLLGLCLTNADTVSHNGDRRSLIKPFFKQH